MWRMMPRLAIATLTATLGTALAAEAPAAAVQSYAYWTDGSISSQAGVAPIYFNGVSSMTFTAPGAIQLGQFDAAATLPASATLTYDNTPFKIDLYVATATSPVGSTNYYEYTITGVMNGSITGLGTSSMVATVTSIVGQPAPTLAGPPASAPFDPSALSVMPQGIVAPYTPSGRDGITVLFAQATPSLGNPTPAPEPSTVAVFGVALAGWAGHRLRRSRNKT